MIQVIWSYPGLVESRSPSDQPVLWSANDDRIMFVPATAQMTFKHYQPKFQDMSWKSVSVGGFKPNGRGCKSDSFVCHNLCLLFGTALTSVLGDQT